jgi:hypothetical protein
VPRQAGALDPDRKLADSGQRRELAERVLIGFALERRRDHVLEADDQVLCVRQREPDDGVGHQ